MGSVEINRLDRLPGVHRVYNLEVETEPPFLASELGVLSHNRTSCGRKKQRDKPSGPDPSAEGRSHSIVEKSGKYGQYTTHNEDGTFKIIPGAQVSHTGVLRDPT